MTQSTPDEYAQLLFGAIDRSKHEIVHHDGQDIAVSIDALPELINQAGIAKPFVVIDTPALEAAELKSYLQRSLSKQRPTYFDQFTPNPSSQDAAIAAERAALRGCDGVVAIGGGSCCDVAKVVALACSLPEFIGELSQGVGLERAVPVPLIAAPTTAGTGSEATHFAAIYVDGKKVSVAHEEIRPASVILDTRFQLAMPKHVAACSGLDALCQAMESTWAVGSTEESLAYARAAGTMIADCLAPSVLHGFETSRRAMMVGANLAGKSIKISKTTAAHALSYQITQACGLAHGHAVALTIGEIAKWNAGVSFKDCVDDRGPLWVAERTAEACKYVGADPASICDTIANILTELGLESSLAKIGVSQDMLAQFADNMDPLRATNNPRRLDPENTLNCLQRSSVGVGVA